MSTIIVGSKSTLIWWGGRLWLQLISVHAAGTAASLGVTVDSTGMFKLHEHLTAPLLLAPGHNYIT
jgi:hypothetical protein